MRAISVVLCLIGVAGCFSPKYANGELRCSQGTHPCPDGYHCAFDNTCWKNGSDPTSGDSADMGGAAIDMMQPPVLTYPPAAAWTSCGGGSASATSGTQLNFSVCSSSVGGTAGSAGNATVTFGFFSDDIY